MRRPFLVLCVIVVAGSLCSAKDYKIHGFVTSITSPTSFDIDDYRITRDNTLSLEIEKDSDDGAAASFKPEDIRVGTELEIKGNYDESTGVLTAKFIKVFLDDTRKIRRTALIEKIPSLQRTDTGWIGTVAADGQRVSIVPSTLVSYKLNQSERKQAKGAKNDKEDTSSLPSADLITLDTFMRYEGTRQPRPSGRHRAMALWRARSIRVPRRLKPSAATISSTSSSSVLNLPSEATQRNTWVNSAAL
jgi:hypothetical protein